MTARKATLGVLGLAVLVSGCQGNQPPPRSSGGGRVPDSEANVNRVLADASFQPTNGEEAEAALSLLAECRAAGMTRSDAVFFFAPYINQGMMSAADYNCLDTNAGHYLRATLAMIPPRPEGPLTDGQVPLEAELTLPPPAPCWR